MDQRRFIAFILTSSLFLFVWGQFIVPRLVPKPPPALADVQVAEGKDPEKDPETEQPAVEVADAGGAKAAEGAPADTPPAIIAAPALFPAEEVELGSLDPNTGYRMRVTVSSRGASIQEISLNDPRYTELPNPGARGPQRLLPLRVVGPADPGAPEFIQSFQTNVKEFVNDIGRTHWEFVEKTESTAKLRIPSADGKLEAIKTYRLEKVGDQPGGVGELAGYQVNVDFTIRNLTDKPQQVQYVMYGPIGLPLENENNIHLFREIIGGFLAEDGTVSTNFVAAKPLVDGAKKETWSKPFQFIGVTQQFFAALLIPESDQLKSGYFSETKPVVIATAAKPEHSDISVQMTSVPLELPAAVAGDDKTGSVTHSFRIFAGPKRSDLVSALKLPGLDHIEWFTLMLPLKPIVDLISPAMLWLLRLFKDLTGNWGVAIILLTVVVRCLMLPLSIKQAISTAKMQALQPELQSLQKKYADRKEELAKATMELYSKNGVNMFGGCLLVLPQMPVFIALYQALNHAVDLRLAPFLYIKNLAAPDSLFALPFVVPFFGWTEFNLLPLLSMSLFMLQQKLFMPPPTSEEQAMQYRMMNIMSVVMGLMFYRIPSGLCLYFICSSVWGVTERLLLPKVFPATRPAAHPTVSASISEPKVAADSTIAAAPADQQSSWFSRIKQAVEQVQKAAEADPQARRKPHSHKKR